jgi:benzoate-CoA ligase
MGVAHIKLPERFNLAVAMLDARLNEGKGDKVAVYYKDHTLSYNDIRKMTNRTGNALKSLGIEMEDRVAILLPDCPEWIASFFGAMKIGGVPVPFNIMLRPNEYQYLLNDSRVKAIIVSHDLVSSIVRIENNLDYLKYIIVVGETEGSQMSYDKLVAEASPELEASATSKNDAALWCYTSGSTGEAKGVVHLHHDLMVHAALFGNEFLGITDRDIIFSVAKLFFSFGTANLAATLYAGAAQVLLPDRPTPKKVLETIATYRPTIVFGVPTLFANILAAQDIDNYDLSSVRICISSGEHLPEGIYHQFKERFGIEPLDCLGSSEALTMYLANKPGMVKPGSSGRPTPASEVKIVDEQGRQLAVGETGELMIKVDSSSPGYWNKHDKTKDTMNGSWLRTGDLCRQDEDGYFYYVGRVDDMVEAGGIKVAPAEIEATLIMHPAVVEAAVVGAPDEFGLDKPKAFVTVNNRYRPSPELARELQQFVKDRIAPYKYPRWIEFVDELPKTATGKIQRFKLRQLARRTG